MAGTVIQLIVMIFNISPIRGEKIAALAGVSLLCGLYIALSIRALRGKPYHWIVNCVVALMAAAQIVSAFTTQLPKYIMMSELGLLSTIITSQSIPRGISGFLWMASAVVYFRGIKRIKAYRKYRVNDNEPKPYQN